VADPVEVNRPCWVNCWEEETCTLDGEISPADPEPAKKVEKSAVLVLKPTVLTFEMFEEVTLSARLFASRAETPVSNAP
jgi:hypothetical protein